MAKQRRPVKTSAKPLRRVKRTENTQKAAPIKAAPAKPKRRGAAAKPAPTSRPSLDASAWPGQPLLERVFYCFRSV